MTASFWKASAIFSVLASQIRSSAEDSEATFSALAADAVAMCCFLDYFNTAPPAIKYTYSKVGFRSNLQSAQFESEYPIATGLSLHALKMMPWRIVPLTNRNTRLAHLQSSALGCCKKRNSMHTANARSVLVQTLKYVKDQIAFLNAVLQSSSPWSKLLSSRHSLELETRFHVSTANLDTIF